MQTFHNLISIPKHLLSFRSMKTMKSMLTSVLIIIGGCLGAIGAFQLQKVGLSPVVASCIVGLLGALVGYWMNSEDLSMVIFAGSFVGMTAISLASFPIMILAGLACGVIYLLAEPIFVGYGGKLGAMAFVSVLLVLFLFWISGKVVG